MGLFSMFCRVIVVFVILRLRMNFYMFIILIFLVVRSFREVWVICLRGVLMLISVRLLGKVFLLFIVYVIEEWYDDK